MKIFKNKHAKAAVKNKALDKAAGWIAGKILKAQWYWVRGMERLFSKLHPTYQKALLICFFLLLFGYSVLLIASGITGAANRMDKPVQPLQTKAIGKINRNIQSAAPVYIERIEKFRNYLDSLGGTKEGRQLRDSILSRRPGLLDSIRAIGRLYSQK